MWKDGNKRHFMQKDGKMEIKDIIMWKDGNFMCEMDILCGKMEIKNILCVERWK